MHAIHALMLGSLSLDLLERAGQRMEAFGGAVCYGGVAAAKEGIAVQALVHLPPAYHSALRQRHAELEWLLLPSRQATRFENAESAKGLREQRCTERAPTLSAKTASEFLDPSAAWDWVHCGPLHPQDLDVALLDQLRLQAKTISMDVQGLLRSIDVQGRVRLDAEALPKTHLNQWLEGVDWVKASHMEWSALEARFGIPAHEACAHWALQGLLLTRGRDGGTLYGPLRHWDWKAEGPVSGGLETGAGDVFLAAFLSHYLAAFGQAAGHGMERSLRSRPAKEGQTGSCLDQHDPAASLKHAASRAAALVASDRQAGESCG